MKVTADFFLVSSASLLEAATKPEAIEGVMEKGSPTVGDLRLPGELLSSGLAGKWQSGVESFDALCWLLDTIGEPVVFEEFRYVPVSMLQESGLLQHFAQSHVFPLPTSPDGLPLAGLLPNSRMESTLVCESASDIPSDPSQRMIRRLLLDLIESAEPDELDLIMVLR